MCARKIWINRVFFIFTPFIVGVVIYILFRSKKLFYYQLVNFVGLNESIDILRKEVWKYRRYIPNWIIYSLPDGLWMFSMGMGIVYNRSNYWMAQLMYTFIFLLTFIMELIQDKFGGHGTFLGTYDEYDLLCFIVGFLLSSIISYIFWIKSYNIEDNKKNSKKEMKKILIVMLIFIILGFFPALSS